ncbi:hypothetical protein DM02DRAFT_725471 [Periconia macrospinosa]|uniref:Dihydrofolate reductase n=1 Tax=Periconia macrospinosa TaxID=97972 RepID=A0A2V1E4K1_9PLEO|nr:hypothetical protein DM02DRAFT_725471 [Periconia macrospinosa]
MNPSTSPPPPTTPQPQQDHQQTMPPPTPLKLTLILAATPSLGIGKNGTLPWPQLRKEMGYFARVTKFVPRGVLPKTAAGVVEGKVKIMNAVVMGRKTWESIPEKFRPLQGRLNIVVSGSLPSTSLSELAWAAAPPDAQQQQQQVLQQEQGEGEGKVGHEGPVIVPSLDAALSFLSSISLPPPPPSSLPLPSSSPTQQHTEEEQVKQTLQIHRTFIIGGAQLYTSSLTLPQTDRVLLTRVQEEYECDTFFPDIFSGSDGWREGSEGEWREWTGEVFENEVGKEGGKKKTVVKREEEEKGLIALQ